MSDNLKELYPLLAEINSPVDLRKLPIEKLPALAGELRRFLINTVSRTSGHLASGLGVVELTIALHYVYNTPKDQLIWDVGHQAYPHKILTGRRDRMNTIRQKGGLHPFLWRKESEYDVFSTGHASTSISEALGLSIANRALGNDKKVVAVIGDGALTGGVAFEAMNHAGDLGANMLVVLNDNEMSISQSVGSLSKHLATWLSSPSYAQLMKSGRDVLKNMPLVRQFAMRAHEHIKGMVVPGTLFEEFGFNYVGPIDGHDIATLISVLKNMRDLKGPQILHIATIKGKGYLPAEENPTAYHGVPKFSPPDGVPNDKAGDANKFSKIFGDWLINQAEQDPKLTAITPAMCEGSGMSEFRDKFPDRYFDVAIAEQHAVLLASGLAAGGMHPVVCVYSTFLQRAYDQIIHDIAIQDLPVVIAIDRGGVVGPDGPTHQGVFDISYIKSIPNMSMMTPSNLKELWEMLNTAYAYDHPAVVRYPRGSGLPNGFSNEDQNKVKWGGATVLCKGCKVAILVWGPLVYDVVKAQNNHGTNYTIVNMRFVKPWDKVLVKKLACTHQEIITLEDGVVNGGIGEEIDAMVANEMLPCRVTNIGIPDEFVEQAQPDEIYREYGMDGESIILRAENLLKSANSV